MLSETLLFFIAGKVEASLISIIVVFEGFIAFGFAAANARASCSVKGSIGIGTVGQNWHDETVFRPEYGVRWFCPEEETRVAGWRRAGY